MADEAETAKPVSLRDKRDTASREARDLASANRDKISQLKQLFSEADSEKKARDAESRQVAALKAQRSEKTGKVVGLKKELSQLYAELKVITKGEAEDPIRLEEQIERLEWTLQTEATNPRKEKELSQQIKELRRKLPAAKGAREMLLKIRSKRAELKVAIEESEKIHEQVGKHARLSQEHHDKMAGAQKQAGKLQNFLSQSFTQLDEKRGEAQEAHEKLVRMREKRDEREKQRVGAQEHARLQELREAKRGLTKKAEAIFARFKAGEKITFEEIQVIQEAGLV